MSEANERFAYKDPARGHHGIAYLVLPYQMSARRARYPRWACLKREYSKTDLAALKEVLPKYGYDIDTTVPPNKDELIKFLDQRAADNYDQYDSILFIFSMFGQRDMYYWEGGFVKIQTILEKLLPTNAPNMADKPKVVIFQICNIPDYTYHEADTCPFIDPERSVLAETITTGSNLAVIQSPLPGRTLWRKGEHGSMFLGYFCEALEEAKDPIDIQKVYYNACDMVDEELTLQAESWYTFSGHPLPYMISSLTKTLILERKKEVKEEEKKDEAVKMEEGKEAEKGGETKDEKSTKKEEEGAVAGTSGTKTEDEAVKMEEGKEAEKGSETKDEKSTKKEEEGAVAGTSGTKTEAPTKMEVDSKSEVTTEKMDV